MKNHLRKMSLIIICFSMLTTLPACSGTDGTYMELALSTTASAVSEPPGSNANTSETSDSSDSSEPCTTGHTAGSAATCTQDQNCTVCGKTLNKALGHAIENSACTRCRQQVADFGTCGPNASWMILKDETDPTLCMLHIYGTGPITSHPWITSHEATGGFLSTPTVIGFESEITAVTISDGITAICNEAFSGCEKLTAVSIASSVTNIGYGTFHGCTGLENITLPNSITNIGYGLFWGCEGLKTVILPNTVTSIGSDAFLGCGKLVYNEYENGKYLGNDKNPYLCLMGVADTTVTVFTMHASTQAVYEYAFSGCSALERTEYQNGYYLGSTENPYLCLTGVIDRDASEFTIPDTTKCIFQTAFGACKKLTAITIPDSVTSIGVAAFRRCNALTTLTVPSSVTNIDSTAFAECSNLTSVVLPDSIPVIHKQMFRACSKLTSVTIPNGVSEIYYGAFYDCTALTKITIPDSVKSIGSDAFRNCTELTSVTISENSSLTEIGSYAFQNCTELTSISVPNGITEITSYLFQNCRSLTDIAIPSSVTSIGSYAFSGCIGLTGITIPDSVQKIGGYAFDGCHRLVEIYNLSSLNIEKGSLSYGGLAYQALNVYTSSTEKSKLHTTDDGYIFCSDESGSYLIGYIGNQSDLILPDQYQGKLYRLIDWAFAYCNQLTSVAVPRGIESIDYAFSNCKSLISVTLPDSVTSIIGAFRNCSSLKSITIPNGVTDIISDTFTGCGNLESIAIPSSVTGISASTFEGCSKLIQTANGISYIDKWVVDCNEEITEAILRENTVGIGSGAFRNCSKLSEITIPNTVKYINAWAFEDCTALQSIIIPDSVSLIEGYAFENCKSMKSITVGSGVTAIGSGAFEGCNSLNAVYISDIDKWCEIEFQAVTASPLNYAGNLYVNGALVDHLPIPEGMTDIKSYAFRGCTCITSISIPKSVTNIGNNALYGCSNLTRILYNGTKVEWAAIEKNGLLNYQTGNFTVQCTDGTLTKSEA